MNKRVLLWYGLIIEKLFFFFNCWKYNRTFHLSNCGLIILLQIVVQNWKEIYLYYEKNSKPL